MGAATSGIASIVSKTLGKTLGFSKAKDSSAATPDATPAATLNPAETEDDRLKRSQGPSDKVLLQGASSSGRKRLLGQ